MQFPPGPPGVKETYYGAIKSSLVFVDKQTSRGVTFNIETNSTKSLKVAKIEVELVTDENIYDATKERSESLWGRVLRHLPFPGRTGG